MLWPPAIEVLASTLESLPIAVMITDGLGVVCFANVQCAQLTGYSVDELVGRNAAILAADEEVLSPRLDLILQQVVDSGEPWSGRSNRKRRNGEHYKTELTISLVKPVVGGIGGPRHLMWAELPVSPDLHPQFQQIADAAPVLIWMSGTDTLCHYFNKPWLDFTGRTLAQERGNGWAEGVHPDDFDSCLRTYVMSFEARIGFTMEYRLRRADGEYRWLLDNGVPRFSETGDFDGFIGSCVDITEQKVAKEEVLREGEAWHRTILQTAMDGYWLVDTQGRLVEVNETYCRMSGYSADELLSMGVADLVVNETEDDVATRITALMAQGESRFEARHRRKDGSVFDVETSIQYRPEGYGQIVCFLKDITERKRAEEALRKSEAQIRLKLDCLLSPEEEVGTLELADIIDVGAVQALLDDFNKLTDLLVAVLDLRGRVLAATGWQDVCTKFHRVNPETCRNCVESDTVLSLGVKPGDVKAFQCKNNMWDVVTPISVGGVHVGNIFTGQFFFEGTEPDLDLFRAQALEFGFDEAAYLDAVNRAPRISRERIAAAMSFFTKLAHMISTLSHSNLKLAKSAHALRESEERYRSILHASPDNITITDLVGRILMASPAAVAMFGLKQEEQCRGHLITEFAVPEDRDLMFSNLALKSKGTITGPNQYRGLRKDGTKFDIEVNSDFIRDSEGQPTGLVFVIRDITQRKLAETVLRDSERLLRDAQRVAGLGTYVLDVTTGNWTSSAKLDEIFGIDQTFDRSVEGWLSLIHPGWREAMTDHLLNHVFKQRLRFDREYKVLRHSDNRELWVHGFGELEFDTEDRPVRMLGAIQDITDRKLLEARFLQAQKMESIGRLAGGVAHDFNNLLTVINGYSEMLLLDRNTGESMRRQVAEILKAGDRAAGLTGQLLAYSRKQVLQPRRLDLNGVVKGMRSLLQRLVGEDVDLCVALDARRGTVHADPHQLDQVMMNLVVNARDAMPGGGTLLIETSNVELDDDYVLANPGAQAGRYVSLAVRDTGVGMDEETRQNIFEPFFTTKEIGKGTGLGLSMVHGIVQQSGGYVSVESKPGATTFTVYLPELAETMPDAGTLAALPALGGEETVLVVEDQPGVLQYAVSALNSYGYRVLQAASKEEALRVFEQSDGGIDLLLTDVVMPNGSGRVLADELELRQPGIKVLYMSGYTDDAIAHHGVLEMGAEFIQKPFSPQQLAAKISLVLGSGS